MCFSGFSAFECGYAATQVCVCCKGQWFFLLSRWCAGLVWSDMIQVCKWFFHLILWVRMPSTRKGFHMLGEINNPCSECVHSGAPSDYKQQTRQWRSVFTVPSHLLPHLHRHVNCSWCDAEPTLCGCPGHSDQAHSAATTFKLEWPKSDFQFLAAGNPPDPQRKPAWHFEQEVQESEFRACKTVGPWWASSLMRDHRSFKTTFFLKPFIHRFKNSSIKFLCK